MDLDEAQKQRVAAWITEGLKLSDIQKRLGSELGISMTYMEVRLLVDDLKLTPKDPERPQVPELGKNKAPAAPANATPAIDEEDELRQPDDAMGGTAPAPRRVSINVDQLARPGSLVSGKVTFSDGKSAQWYLDQSGRLGLIPQEAGYKPAASDVQAFQLELQDELARLGF